MRLASERVAYSACSTTCRRKYQPPSVASAAATARNAIAARRRNCIASAAAFFNWRRRGPMGRSAMTPRLQAQRVEQQEHRRPQQHADGRRSPCRGREQGLAQREMQHGGDDAVVHEQGADRERLLRQREEAQSRAEPLQDERHDDQAQRLFAEQVAEDEIGDEADEECEAEACFLGFFEHPVSDREPEPVRTQRHQRRGQRHQPEQQREHDADGQDPTGALAAHGVRLVVEAAAGAVCAAFGTVADAGAATETALGRTAVDTAGGPITGRGGALRSSSTSRPRSSCAAGFTSPTRNARLSSGRNAAMVPTGKPAGNRSPRPDVTTTSPTLTSLDKGMLASARRSVRPVPYATSRTPLRSTATGNAWSGSVSSSAVECIASTEMIWPTTPPASMTTWPTRTPSPVPASSTRRWRVGSRSMSSTGASWTSRPPRSTAPSRPRMRSLSAVAACRRAMRAPLTSSALRKRRFSAISELRVPASSLMESTTLPGQPATAHSGWTKTCACSRPRVSQPPRWSSTMSTHASPRYASNLSVPAMSPGRAAAGPA